ncbi:MAG: P1 family peptidase [Candidatus Acidiferrales bacterium]
MAKGLTDIPGIRVGHASDFEAVTGCTVILFGREGAAAAVDLRGGAVGERELETLRPGHLVERVHGLVLAGGSAFGLDAAGGVMRYLEERGIGFETGAARVPIVPAVILYDLAIGNPRRRPDAAMGYQAARKATAAPVEEGSVGAGTGATVGKLFGIARATKGGLGTATVKLVSGVMVSALAVVNAFGDVREHSTGKIVAGLRRAPGSSKFSDTLAQMQRGAVRRSFGRPARAAGNTTLAVVATDARFERTSLLRIAAMAQAGVARTIAPVHSTFDGDVVFAISLGRKRADVNSVGVAAAEALAQAIVRAVQKAKGLGGVPALRELRRSRTAGPRRRRA